MITEELLEQAEAETERLPYPPHLDAYTPAVVTRAKLGDAEALAELERLAADPDVRTRQKVLGARLKAGVGDRAALLEAGLRDTTADVRTVALKEMPYNGLHGCERLVPLVARALNDRAQPLHTLASEALRRVATTDEELLASIYPYLELLRAPLPYPANASLRQKAEIDQKNEERRQRDIAVRYAAITALCYNHGSMRTQEALLAVFDRPELQNKRTLTRAFPCCPDRPRLAEEMKHRLSDPRPGQALSALWVLAALELPALRPTFLAHMQSDNPEWAHAAADGLMAVAQPDDLDALRRFSAKWQTGPTPPLEKRTPAIIRGVHTMFYTSEAVALRDFLREVLLFPGKDVDKEGWWIFDMPEADMGCHPTEGTDEPSGTRDVSFYCDDIAYSVAEMEKRGVEFEGPVVDQGFGLVTRFRVPGGFSVQLYQPKY